ncbi:MAG: T9SS type A sorting domain-containing protein [Bacteroidota bacterium]
MLRFTALALILAFAPSALAQDLAPRVFPNPVSTDRVVTVEITDAEVATVEVVDVLGRIVSLDAPLAAGTYLVRARYADGRTTEPAPITIATPGTIELRLVDDAPAAWADAPQSAPLPTEANQSLACSQDQIFGGFYLQSNVGSLNPRPELSPAVTIVKPLSSNDADFTTCFGEVQGSAFRYASGEDFGDFPMRILSPSIEGNTNVTYEVLGNDGNAAFSAQYGWQETDLGGLLVSEFELDTPFFPGLGLFELIVLNDGVVVDRNVYDGAEGLFLSSKGPQGRINLLRSILMTSIVDGFDVAGGGKPGDISFVFELESGDGIDVNVHAGAGAPIVGVGDVIHITPKFAIPNPFEWVINEIRTVTAGMNRYGLRALRFAVGGSNDPFFGSEAQFARVSGDFVDNPQYNPVFDAELPFMNVQGSVFGTPDVYGVQYGRLPGALEEVGSDEMGVVHTPIAFARGASGVILDDVGEYYRTVSLVRNETDVEGETVRVQIENTGTGTSIQVWNDEGTFGTYQFVYDANSDGTNNIVRTFNVGDIEEFSPNSTTILASGASDFDDSYNDAGSTQDFFVAFLVDIGGGNGGIVYVFPDFTSVDADVDVRAHTIEANQPWEVFGVRERDETDPPAPLTIFGGSAKSQSE